MWRADASITTGVYNTKRKSITWATSAELWDSTRVWDRSHYFGASLLTMERIGSNKGYSLVGCDLTGTNAFFVRSDLVGGKFSGPFTAIEFYEPPRYFLSRRVAYGRAFRETIEQ
jgi:hypothetical protein